MSLINDALRRAREQQKKSPPKGPAPSPVPAADTGHHWYFILFIVLLLIVAGILIFLATRSHPGQPASLPSSHTTEASPPPTLPASIPPRAPAAPGITVPAPVVAAAAVATTSAPPPITVLAPPAGPRLQGILYNVAQPTAIISGKTVRVGSTVGGYKVKAIFPTEVDLIGPDQSVTNLMLPQ
jgi:hypothetical protein